MAWKEVLEIIRVILVEIRKIIYKIAKLEIKTVPGIINTIFALGVIINVISGGNLFSIEALLLSTIVIFSPIIVWYGELRKPI